MKKVPIWVILIFIVLFIIGLIILVNIPYEDTQEINLNQDMIQDNFLIQNNTKAEFDNSIFPIIEELNIFIVTKIIDGDTIEVNNGTKIRLICIDTPEMGEEYYYESKNYLTNLILNKEIQLEKDISDVDKYGRLLRYVYLENDFINELIVLGGYGKYYPYNPDIALCSKIENAEQIARNKNLGIWKIIEQEIEEIGIVCSSNYYNCGDFSSQREAQEFFEYCGGINNDVHYLDGDKDGKACESLQ